MTDINVKEAAFVGHLNDADPGYTPNSKTVLVHDQTTRTNTNCCRLTIIILHSHGNTNDDRGFHVIRKDNSTDRNTSCPSI